MAKISFLMSVRDPILQLLLQGRGLITFPFAVTTHYFCLKRRTNNTLQENLRKFIVYGNDFPL